MKKLPPKIRSFTGRPSDSFEEKNFRRQLIAAVEHLERVKKKNDPTPEFKRITKTIHLLVPANDAAREFAMDVISKTGYVPAEPFSKVIELANYAARNGWVQFCNELLTVTKKNRGKFNPSVEQMINEQLNKLDNERK